MLRHPIPVPIFSPDSPSSHRPASIFLPYCPASFPRTRRTALYPGTGNEAVLEPLRFFVRDRTSGQKPGRYVPGLLTAGQRNALVCAPQSFRERNRKTLAANRVARFTHRMSGANNAGSKLSAFITRQNRRRPAVPCFELGKEGQTPSVASSPVPQAAADTVPVSAPSSFPLGLRQAAAFRRVEVRP
jgi:hypothetical protein